MSGVKTWDDYEARINSSYGGGHHTDGKMDAYRHGINTAFNCVRAEFPSPAVCRNAGAILRALAYMADPNNWIGDDKELLKRPGGSRQEGIVLYSAGILPRVFAEMVLENIEKE